MLADLQERFRAALLDPAQPVPAGVTSHTLTRPPRRFAVYRNNVTMGLAAALASRFPAAQAIVGEDFFNGMAALFVRAHPPRSPLLLGYGDELPAFVEAFQPAHEVPYLADVIRLEIARSEAYHAADAVPATVAELQALDPEGLGAMRVNLHPAARLIRSSWPVATIHAMNAGAGDARAIEDWKAEDVLIARPQLEVLTTILPPGGFAFLAALRDGETLGGAVEAAVAETDAFEPGPALAGLIANGVALTFSL
jgi:hypothetical protein